MRKKFFKKFSAPPLLSVKIKVILRQSPQDE